MKNIQKILTLIIVALIIIVIACEKKQSANFIPPKISNAKKLASKTSPSVNGPCTNCATTIPKNSCNACVKSTMMKNQTSVSGTIAWDSNNGCCSGSSTFTICYDNAGSSNSCDLLMQINNLPTCLQGCLTPLSSTWCIPFTITSATCDPNGTTYDVKGDFYDPNTGNNLTFEFTNDPYISICCTDPNGVQNCCHGQF